MTKHNSHEWKKEEEDGGRGGDGDGSIADDVVPLSLPHVDVGLWRPTSGCSLACSLAACLWRFLYIIWPILAAICSRGFVQQRQRAVPSNRDVFPAGSENILVTWPTLEREQT